MAATVAYSLQRSWREEESSFGDNPFAMTETEQTANQCKFQMRDPNATAPAISNKLDPIPMPNASATSNFCELQFQRPPISAKTNASATTAIQTRARTLNQCNCDNSNPNQSNNLEPIQLLPPLSATSNLQPAYTAYSTP